jgi:hypothetical protein
MEPTFIVYVGTMTVLCMFASNIVLKNINNSETIIRKKKFKHYRRI